MNRSSAMTYEPPPCPHCQKDRGASMKSTAWGHHYYCCSDACGMAFRDSPELARRQLAAAEYGLARATETRDHWAARLAEALGVRS